MNDLERAEHLCRWIVEHTALDIKANRHTECGLYGGDDHDFIVRVAAGVDGPACYVQRVAWNIFMDREAQVFFNFEGVIGVWTAAVASPPEGYDEVGTATYVELLEHDEYGGVYRKEILIPHGWPNQETDRPILNHRHGPFAWEDPPVVIVGPEDDPHGQGAEGADGPGEVRG